MPSKKFADGWEIQQYCRSIAEKFDFAGKALFHTQITSLRWDEGIQRWRIATNRGDDIRSRFVTLACGVLNMPKLPGQIGRAHVWTPGTHAQLVCRPPLEQKTR